MKKENMNEYALPFAAWELRLYLDTHPDDECALKEYRRLCAASGGNCNYACHTERTRPAPYANVRNGSNLGGCGFAGNMRGGVLPMQRAENNGNVGTGGCGCGCDGMNSADTANVWSWIDGPWPWEPEANGGDC